MELVCIIEHTFRVKQSICRKEFQAMLMSYNDFLYLYNISSDEIKNRVIEILTLSQRQPESPEAPECIDHIGA